MSDLQIINKRPTRLWLLAKGLIFAVVTTFSIFAGLTVYEDIANYESAYDLHTYHYNGLKDAKYKGDKWSIDYHSRGLKNAPKPAPLDISEQEYDIKEFLHSLFFVIACGTSILVPLFIVSFLFRWGGPRRYVYPRDRAPKAQKYWKIIFTSGLIVAPFAPISIYALMGNNFYMEQSIAISGTIFAISCVMVLWRNKYVVNDAYCDVVKSIGMSPFKTAIAGCFWLTISAIVMVAFIAIFGYFEINGAVVVFGVLGAIIGCGMLIIGLQALLQGIIGGGNYRAMLSALVANTDFKITYFIRDGMGHSLLALDENAKKLCLNGTFINFAELKKLGYSSNGQNSHCIKLFTNNGGVHRLFLDNSRTMEDEYHRIVAKLGFN